METVNITRFNIGKKGEARYFNVRLAPDAKKIIAIETGVFFKHPLTSSEVNYQQEKWIRCYRNRVMGLLKIQGTGKANVFYATEIIEKERNTGMADYSIEYYPVPKIPVPNADGRDYANPVRYWSSEPWTHGKGMVADPVQIECGCNSFTGYYKDEYGKAMNADIEYTVQVYVWYEV
jgi:hypothetical protein